MKGLKLRSYALYMAIIVGLFTSGCVQHMVIQKVPTIGEATYLTSKELTYRASLPQKQKNIIVVTSLVNVNNFNQSSDFGRLYSDSMITNFERENWTVIDYRGKNIVSKTKKGEFFLNRDKLKLLPKNAVVFVGTYGKYKNGLVLNLRILNATDNKVIAASNVHLIDKEAVALSLKSNCNDLKCKSHTKKEEKKFTIHIAPDDCKASNNCKKSLK